VSLRHAGERSILVKLEKPLVQRDGASRDEIAQVASHAPLGRTAGSQTTPCLLTFTECSPNLMESGYLATPEAPAAATARPSSLTL